MGASRQRVGEGTCRLTRLWVLWEAKSNLVVVPICKMYIQYLSRVKIGCTNNFCMGIYAIMVTLGCALEIVHVPNKFESVNKKNFVIILLNESLKAFFKLV